MTDYERAREYYEKEYLPKFNNAEGDPVCFDEFYENDWKQMVPLTPKRSGVELNGKVWKKFCEFFREEKGYDDWTEEEIDYSRTDDDIEEFMLWLVKENENLKLENNSRRKVYIVHEDTEEDEVFTTREKAFDFFYGILSEDEVENKEEVRSGEELPYGYTKYGNQVYIAEAIINN